MKLASPAQADLFADLDPIHLDLARPAHSRSDSFSRGRTQRRSRVLDAEAAVQVLEASNDYRVLRRLKPRDIEPSYKLGPGEAIAVIVDVETTGLDHRRDEVIEIGMVSFVHDGTGRIGPVLGVLSLLHEPKGEISSQITRLTGITQEMVAGAVLDIDAVCALLAPADLVIAHNAKFDRNFCERLHGDFRHKAWACSVADVRWGDLGYEGAKLGYLIAQNGWFHRSHRAVDDCHALLEVLAADLRDGSGPALGHLLTASQRTRVRIWAQHAPYDMKDVLKRRGYRWNGGDDGRPKAWLTEIDEGVLDVELRFLEQEVYLRKIDLRREVITACERYRVG